MSTVDFCRGSGGAFLAINNLVVAGEMHPDGSNRVIQAFEIDPLQLLQALRREVAPASRLCVPCERVFEAPAGPDCPYCGSGLT